MAKSDNLGQLLYQLDIDGNTVLHVAASVGSIALVNYIMEETNVKVTTKNKNGFIYIKICYQYYINEIIYILFIYYINYYFMWFYF
ncbi:BnaC03g71720D [Brassica napus]|uniref:(rape) hypothetical protein n=1 Tax=Brassica napus TaxID=3708 RepID=A0A078IT15_BRANA|nr:unnamed protein product [Brassica napus]CDY52564.1 BnaC03g71720D [Brassica napus]